MPNSILNVILGISAAIVALVAFGGEIASSWNFNLFGNLRFKVLLTTVMFGVGIWATILKDRKSSKELADSQELFQKHQDSLILDYTEKLRCRDSVSNKRLEFREDSLEGDYVQKLKAGNLENLKVYSGLLTASNMRAFKAEEKLGELIKDSTSTERPDFGIANKVMAQPHKIHYNFKGDSILGNISFENSGNCPIRASVKIYVCALTDKQMNMIPGQLFIFNEISFSQGDGVDWPLAIYDASRIDQLMFLIQGYFHSKSRKDIRIPINEVAIWDSNSESWGSPAMVSAETRIRDFFRKNGIQN